MRNVLPNFPDVELEISSVSEDGQAACVLYVGNETDILAAGIVGTDLLAKRDPKARRPGGGRRDVDGDRVRVERWNLVRAGVVVPRIKLYFREKLMQNARKLPGFAAAWDEWVRHESRITEIEPEAEARERSEDRERHEARYRAEELVVRSLRRMPVKGFVSADEALRFLTDLRDVVQLTEIRRGARADLVACLAGQISLSQTARLLNELPTYDEVVANRPERAAPQLCLVVDNTRH